MISYPKIPTVWARDPRTNNKTLIEGAWATPELAYLADKPWLFTEKVDGVNIRIIWIEGGPHGTLRIEGRTDKTELQQPGLMSALWGIFEPQLARFADVFAGAKLNEHPVCLYGEGYGGGIQGKTYGRDDPGFVLFDVRVGDWWLERNNVLDVAAEFDLLAVRKVGACGTLLDMIALAREGFHSAFGPLEAEGIVATPTTQLLARDGSRIITKIKTKDFPKGTGKETK